MDDYQRLIEDGINNPHTHEYAVAIQELLPKCMPDHHDCWWQHRALRAEDQLTYLHEEIDIATKSRAGAEARLARAVEIAKPIQHLDIDRHESWNSGNWSAFKDAIGTLLAELKGDG